MEGMTDERLDMPVLQDDMDAEEHMRKIRYWERYEAEMVAHFQKQIAAAKEKAASRIEWHKRLLYDYFARVPHDSTKTQESYALPSGRLVYKRATEKMVRPQDEKGFLLHLAEEGITEYTKTKIEESLDWQGYKKRLKIVDGVVVDKETGEIVDEVGIEQVEPDFVIKLDEDEEEKTNGEQENQIA